MSAPEPPAAARWLAAASHFGLPVFMAVVTSVAALGIFDFTWVGRVPSWMFGALPVLPFAILWSASRWFPARKFIVAHAGRAVIFQVMCLAVMGIVSVVENDVPQFVVGTIAAILFCAWLALPFGAATRALEGKMGWYPFVARIIPDPPAV